MVQNCCVEEGSAVASDRGVQERAGIDRVVGDVGVGLGLQVGIGQAEDVGQGLQARAGDSWRLMAPEVETEYWDTVLPTSKVLAPASVTESETGAPGWTALSRSAQRPPQPVSAGWSGTEVCHWVTWSACEKSWGGRFGRRRSCTGPGQGVDQGAGVEEDGEPSLRRRGSGAGCSRGASRNHARR